MTRLAVDDWLDANQRHLTAALARIRGDLERHAGTEDLGNAQRSASEEGVEETPAPATLETLCALFGLSSFERSTLLLCAAVELDAAFPALCAAAQGNAGRPYATFGLALAALPRPALERPLPCCASAPLAARGGRWGEPHAGPLADRRAGSPPSGRPAIPGRAPRRQSWGPCKQPKSCCLPNGHSPPAWPRRGLGAQAARYPWLSFRVATRRAGWR